MANGFRKAIEFVLAWEGGYVHNPDDPGGETKYGISKRSHPTVDIEALTRDQAEAIYYERYWPATGGALSGFSFQESLATALFDYGVHSGTRRAVIELQALVGATADGIIGPVTLDAIDRKAYELLAVALTGERQRFLAQLVEDDPDGVGQFSAGWNRRLASLVNLIERGHA